jgi:hypothetical protein
MAGRQQTTGGFPMETIQQFVSRRWPRLGRCLALAMLATTIVVSGAEAKKLAFSALISSAQETPPSPTAAHGNALLTYDTTTDMLCFAISYSGLGSAEIVAHIHGPAAPGTPAGIVFPLPAGNPKSGCVGPLTSTQYSELKKGLHYINIHTSGFPGGEIRGQIILEKGAKYP